MVQFLRAQQAAHGARRNNPLVIGCAFTGARYRRNDLRPAFRASYMPLSASKNIEEAHQVFDMGVRYLHFHARNPETGEQCADLDWYMQVAEGVRKYCPGAVLSKGSSRTGVEVHQAIRQFGEYARSIGLEALPDVFTNFAAVEILMFERENSRTRPTDLRPAVIKKHFIAVLERMKALKIAQEVEITTLPQSFDVLEQIREDPELSFLTPLNIVNLLGFSAEMPISALAYERSIDRARNLLKLIGGIGSITVGAVVRPTESIDPTQVLSWVLRDNRVTAFRTGIEDHPALGGRQRTNPELVAHMMAYCKANGVEVLTDPAAVRTAFHL